MLGFASRCVITLVIATVPLAPEARGEEAAPRPRLADEIRWARATWPGDLAGVRFTSLLPRLLGWVPPGGEVETFLFAPGHACSRVLLSRPRDEPGYLHGKIIIREQQDRKRPARQCGHFSISEGGALNVETGGSQERQRKDGRWVESSGWGVGDGGTDVGFLSDVADDVARFAGEPLRIEGWCSGPWKWLACEGGGERPCAGCEDVVVAAVPLVGGVGFASEPPAGRPSTCSDSCPHRSPSAALQRLRALAERVHPWRAQPLPPAATPSLHRTREACIATHLRARKR